MTVQSYDPFRTTLLGREELKELSRPRAAPVVRDVALRWALMLAIWGAAAAYPHPAVIAAAMLLVGINYYGLHIIAHDGLHRRLFADPRRNDLFNDLLLLGPICAVTRLNRVNHMEHHKVTCLPEDPDRHKYVHEGKAPPFGFLVFVTGLGNLVPTFLNIFRPKAVAAPDAHASERYSAANLAVIAGWQLALFGGLTWAIGWWAYPVLWLAPVYLFAYRGDLVRVFCEHAMLTDDASADASMRLVSYRSNWLERQLFAPQNMNFHMAHHLWPSIPYYNLPKADALVRARANGDPRLVWRGSYLGFLFDYVRWRMAARAPALASG